MIALSDENRHITANSFDLFGETVHKVLPDGTLTESRNYDTAGNLTSLTHFNGVATTYTYDSLNRLLSRATPGETTASFTYTPTGKYLTSTAGDGTVNYTYDSLDRLTTKATPEGTLSYTYDAAGHVASIQSSNTNGANVSYTYDDLDRLSTVVDNHLSGNNTTTYTYDAASNLGTVAYPNGLQSSFTYDALNRLTAMNAGTASYSYQLGPTGNRTQASESNGRTLNWTYDGIYRLTNEAITNDPNSVNGSVAYGLDPVGNRLSDTSSLAGISTGSFGYNADDEVSTETYDNNGNTLTTGGKSFTYDAENHLTGMSVSGTAVSIVYDAFGNRVSKTANGVTTKYLVEDDVNPTGLPQVMEETVGGAVQRVYTYGLQRVSEYQVVNSAWTPSFYGYDGSGSVRQLTSSTGSVTDTYEYDAFGNELNHTGTTPNNYLYRGEQWDPDLSLYYLRARYYNPLTGKFLSRDPLPGHITIPGTLHKYLYASADPVNRIDPFGQEDEEEEAGADLDSEANAQSELPKLGKRLNCILNAAAGAFDAFSAIESGDLLGSGQSAVNIVALWEECAGEAQGEPGEQPKPESGEGATCPKCFAAGTPIHTSRGDVPVEKIEVGDDVVARNVATGQVETRPVTALTPLHKGDLLEIRVEGERSPLRPSVGHPFWVKRGEATDGTWIEAGKIQAGDLLQTIEGKWRRVVAATPIRGQETVYNFTVANDHDYFVGETGFLVHNANCNCDKHHIIPKFLGGDPDGPTALIPRDFHQNVITPAFRAAAGAFEYGYNYGRGRVLTPDELKQILRNVYRENPLSDAIKECLE